ncbi:MAG TPA: hypothetical protein ENN34_05320 [Deltaproteobacteria bacterium]|nr:hypothetical protein [Deltaproteobacteria bacterium]
MKRIALLCLLCLASTPALGDAEQSWILKKDAEGIKVYTRSVEGSDSNEFKAITDVDAPIEVLLEVFQDIPSFPQWYGFCKEIRLIEQVSPIHRIIYFVLETPWPVKDRDMVVEVRDDVDTSPGTALITMHALEEEMVSRNERYVRMTEVRGSAVLESIDGKRTHVVHTVLADPAGFIPAAVSNMLQKEQPFLTLKGLKEMVKQDVYYERAGVVR